MRILLYQAQQNEIGGVETFNMNFCKRLSKYYDITFLCEVGDAYQLSQLEKYAKVVIYSGQMFETDICIFSSAWGIRPIDNIIADKYIQMVHADFKGIEEHWNFHYKKLDKVTEHWCGGENIAKTFEEKYGIPCKVIPYLLDNDIKTDRVLHLISTTRIAKEKGMHRVVKLAKKLKEHGRPFDWNIWGTGFDQAFVNKIQFQLRDVPEVAFRGLGRNLQSYVKDADFSVQLSDTEGFAFSIFEARQLDVPVIATDFPNAYEQITDGKTGYIVDMDLAKCTDEWIDNLYDKKLDFKFEELSTEQDWIKAIGKPTGKRKKTKIILPKQVKVKCVKKYFDVQLKCKVKENTIYDVSEMRANELVAKHLVEMMKIYS